MALSVSPVKLLIFSLMIHVHISLNLHVHAQVDEASLKLMSDTLEWSLPMSSLFEDPFDENEEDELELHDNEEDGDQFGRRSLFWQRTKYYISYGALSANRIPCPPRSGRSYYTHNCYKARGPVHPYTRGCSMITRCRS